MQNQTLKGRDKKIIINDATICYDDFGNGITPLIFIHGFPFDKSSWRPQIDFLQNNYRVIGYDIRGYGKSSKGDEQLSISLFAEDLINFMDQLAIPKAIVCGLSMGGYILLNAVNRYPERFKAIVLSDTQCIADTSEGKIKRLISITQINAGNRDEFIAGFTKNIFCENTQLNNKQTIDEVKKVMYATSSSTITGTLNALAQREEMCSSLIKISIPSLIICGKEDIVTPPFQAEYMHLHIKNSSLRIIEEAGHLSNLEQAEEFNKYLNEFIDNLK